MNFVILVWGFVVIHWIWFAGGGVAWLISGAILNFVWDEDEDWLSGIGVFIRGMIVNPGRFIFMLILLIIQTPSIIYQKSDWGLDLSKKK